MLKADLHIHTTASDGVFTPSKVVLRAKEKHVNLLAITDHDCIFGISEAKACAAKMDMQIISGVELSTGGGAEVHVLGYGIDENNEKLNAFLQEMRCERRERAAKICQKLKEIGKPIELPEEYMNGNLALGRPQIARAMMAKGYVSSVQQAFEKYIGSGCPAYVERRKIATADAVRFLRDIDCVPVLAHPSLIRMTEEEMNSAISSWIDAGLMGVEIYHPAMFESHREKWRPIAKKYNLLITGGSDFHAPGDKHAEIGEMIPGWKTCNEDAERLLDAVRNAK